MSFSLLFFTSAITVGLFYLAAILESKKGLGLSIVHALLGPIGSFMIVLGFASGILQVKSNRALMWRGRAYFMTSQIQNSINV
jgi:hypothetical protein